MISDYKTLLQNTGKGRAQKITIQEVRMLCYVCKEEKMEGVRSRVVSSIFSIEENFAHVIFN
jgi:hypothetical protein